MWCQKQRTAKENKQGNQKEKTVKRGMPDFGVMLPQALPSLPPLKSLSVIAAKAGCTSSSEIPEIVAGVLDVVERQNDKEGRGFMKLHGAQIKNTVLY